MLFLYFVLFVKVFSSLMSMISSENFKFGNGVVLKMGNARGSRLCFLSCMCLH